MARPRKTANTHLPDNIYIRLRKRKSGKVIKYFTYRIIGKKEISLGTNYNLACIKAAKLNLERGDKDDKITFTMVAIRFKNEIIPTKKENTQKGYRTYIVPILQYFEDAPLDQIEPQHIAKYFQWRKDTPAAANNEMMLFHQIWSYARAWGYTNQPCPTIDIKRNKVNRRDFYVTDQLYLIVYNVANQLVKDLMDVAYLTGQRPVDIAKMKFSHIENGYLHVVQDKTNAKVRFEVIGKLSEIIQRRKENRKEWIFTSPRGYKLNRNKIGEYFLQAKQKAIAKHPEYTDELKQFQFRDLRAKSGTDKAMSQGLEAARQQLGHTTAKMTQTYIRQPVPIAPLLSTPTDKSDK